MVKKLAWVAAIVLALAIAGCGKAPQTEMEQAQAALTGEQAQDLEQYAPDAFAAARDTLKVAMAAKEAQDSKFALFRSYGTVKEMFITARKMADSATVQAESEKERVRGEAEQALSQAQTLVDSVNALLAKAPKGKDTKAELELIKSEIASLAPALADARAEMDAGKYLVAKTKTEAVMEKAQSVANELNAAIARKSTR